LGFRNLGLQWSVRQLFTGLGLVIVSLLGYFLFGLGVSLIRHALSIPLAVGPTAKQIFGRPTWITIPFYFVNPIFEELIVRAYAMAEIGELTGSWKIAAVASALIQASYHLYYGWVTATAIFFQFLIFSLYFARARKATPVIVAHAAFDFYGLVRMW
jgi:membrane protease YdiL (CAAX protease family)